MIAQHRHDLFWMPLEGRLLKVSSCPLKERKMATITAYKFDTADGAQNMLVLVRSLADQQLVDLQDAAMVTWPEGNKKPTTVHHDDLTAEGAMGGAFWGFLFGLIFFVPFFGMAVGAVMGALSGHFTKYGIDDEFITSTQDKVTEGTSALFLMTKDAVTDKVAEALRSKGINFELFYTNLTIDQEQQLRADFAA
jgi:uncharacterized membrane protein